jgi:putative ABC transport system permease protein
VSLRDLISDTFRTLRAHKLRTALTMFGIAWGIVSIMLMVAAGEGLRVGQQKVAASFGKDLMIVFAGRTSLQAGGVRAGRNLWWHDTDYLAIRDQAPDCRWVLPELGQSNIPARSSFNAGAFRVTGSLPIFSEMRAIPIAKGRFYNEDDELEGRRVAILGAEVKKQLFGDRRALGETIRLDRFPYIVIGEMERKEQDSDYDGPDINKIFIPFSAVIRDFPDRPPGTAHTIDRILVTPRSIEQHEPCKGQVRRALAHIYGFDPQDEEATPIWDTIEEAKAFGVMARGMKYFLGGVGLTTLFLGGIGVMNVMLVAVKERTREIGVRKAVGATARAVTMLFFAESLIVVFLSGGIGLGVGFGLCSLVNLLPMPMFFAGLLPTLGSSLLAFGLLGLTAILSAIYPAARAASIDPIEALRQEPGG